MGLSFTVQDGVLNWFRGQAMGTPPDALFLGFHSAAPGRGLNEVSPRFGGRVALMGVDLSDPVTGDDGLRQVHNLRALMSGAAEVQQLVAAVSLWSANSGGILLMDNALAPAMTIAKGDPIVFFVGDLILRAVS